MEPTNATRSHFATLPPAESFRALAKWASLAADAMDRGDDQMAVVWSTFMWSAVVLGHADARRVFKRGLDRAQRMIGPLDSDWG